MANELHATRAAKTLMNARRVAKKFSKEQIEEMRLRTEWRIDFMEPARRSVVVALGYSTLGAFVSLPAALIWPMLVPAAGILSIVGLILLTALHRARARLRDGYATHSAWRILSLASGIAGSPTESQDTFI